MTPSLAQGSCPPTKGDSVCYMPRRAPCTHKPPVSNRAVAGVFASKEETGEGYMWGHGGVSSWTELELQKKVE